MKVSDMFDVFTHCTHCNAQLGKKMIIEIKRILHLSRNIKYTNHNYQA